ncbi:MAG: hypothetical protein OXF79_24875 [Chloroflexi bacterium]|nr:hypothetical protein [Chloroflexota bacterium]
MRAFHVLAIAATAIILAAGCAANDRVAPTNDGETAHMVAEAKLTAHYIAAALEAGKSPEEINATLMEIANTSVIAEFWVSDETGRVEFTTQPGLDFAFPTDPDAGTQAAPFADLLLGNKQVVTQAMQPREADGKPFQYVGVTGVDQPRIVQVGIAGPAK